MKLLMALSIAIASPLIGCSQSNGRKMSVVFVCEHGAARSVIASNYFERLANENGLSVSVTFRGLSPDSSINKITKEELTKDGFAFGNETPRLLTNEDVKRSDVIVMLDCLLPETFNSYRDKVLKYQGIPSINEKYFFGKRQH